MKRASLIITVALATTLPASMSLAQAPAAPAAAPPPPAKAGATLAAVQSRGSLNCGVTTGLPGFSNPDDKGNWTGLDVDLCRGIAAAILNDPNKINYVKLTAANRFPALQSREIDVLSRNTTWTLSRDTSLGLNFAGINYYDGQGFMVKKEINISSAAKLEGASFCVQSGTTNEQNLTDYFKSINVKIKEVLSFQTSQEAIRAYESNRCDSFTSDVSQVYALRLETGNPGNHVVLPEVISKEPLGPVVRQDDDQWMDIVRWTLNAMINAEELGVTQENVKQMASNPPNPEVRRLLGVDGNLGETLGLTKDWVVRIISATGNYGQSFERNVGTGSRLAISRGLNRLWNQGGIMYAPPIR